MDLDKHELQRQGLNEVQVAFGLALDLLDVAQTNLRIARVATVARLREIAVDNAREQLEHVVGLLQAGKDVVRDCRNLQTDPVQEEVES